VRVRIARVVGMALLLALASVSAFAHRPVAIGGVFDGPAAAAQLGPVDVSQVVYGELPAGRASLWIAVDVPGATDLRMTLGIPALDRLRTYRVQWAVLGPELPLIALPISVPSGLGGMLVLSTPVGDSALVHEPITDTQSWIVGEATAHLPTGGRYYVVAWSASIMDGKAWIAAGEREVLGWQDIVGLRQTIERARAFHEAGTDLRFVALSKALYLAGIALVIALLALL